MKFFHPGFNHAYLNADGSVTFYSINGSHTRSGKILPVADRFTTLRSAKTIASPSGRIWLIRDDFRGETKDRQWLIPAKYQPLNEQMRLRITPTENGDWQIFDLEGYHLDVVLATPTFESPRDGILLINPIDGKCLRFENDEVFDKYQVHTGVNYCALEYFDGVYGLNYTPVMRNKITLRNHALEETKEA